MLTTPIDKQGYNLLHDGVMCFSDMQQNGIRIDVGHCKHQYKKLGKDIKEQNEKLMSHKEIKQWKKIYGKKFNINSDDQLSDILYNKLKHTPQKTTESGNPSVDQEALKALGIPMVDDYLRYRKLDKIRNTFLRNLLREQHGGWLHPFLNLNTARTYRSSSDRVNIQNQPTRDPEAGEIIRRAFISREGHCLVAGDYGGVEVKGSAWYHEDPVMLSYLRDPENSDMHADFCMLLFKLTGLNEEIKGEKTLRKGTKNGFTFPQFYGDYYGNNAVSLFGWADLKTDSRGRIKSDSGIKIRDGKPLGQHLRENGIKTFKKFMDHVESIEQDMWERRFRVYKQWRDNQYNWYLKHGYVSILSGFICKGIMTRNATINYPIQGVCFHALLKSIIELNKWIKKLGMKTKLIFQVHDEVVADVPYKEYDDFMELMKQVMVHEIRDHFPFINTPLELEAEASEIDGNWFEMESALKYIS